MRRRSDTVAFVYQKRVGRGRPHLQLANASGCGAVPMAGLRTFLLDDLHAQVTPRTLKEVNGGKRKADHAAHS